MTSIDQVVSESSSNVLRTAGDAEAQARRAMSEGWSLERMRREYDETGISPSYNGYSSIGLLSLVCFGTILFLTNMLGELSLVEWAVIPITLIYANLAEYALHRWIMHKPFPGLRKLYVRHALTHHRLYRADSMDISRHRELQLILLPWYIIFVYMGIFITPMALLVSQLLSWDAGYLFAVTTVFYYWHYEFLHMIYHLPRNSVVYRWLPFMRSVAKLHTRHHEMHLMANSNFNHTYPLFDFVFGTWVREDADRGEHPIRV